MVQVPVVSQDEVDIATFRDMGTIGEGDERDVLEEVHGEVAFLVFTYWWVNVFYLRPNLMMKPNDQYEVYRLHVFTAFLRIPFLLLHFRPSLFESQTVQLSKEQVLDLV